MEHGSYYFSWCLLAINGIVSGAFAAMALLGKIDQILAPKGISMTVAPLGAVCAVLFATPSSPGARVANFLLSFFLCSNVYQHFIFKAMLILITVSPIYNSSILKTLHSF